MSSMPVREVAVTPLFRDAQVAVQRWVCTADNAEARTPVMQRSSYLLSFTHTGTFVVHARDRAQIIDATRAMVIRAEEPFCMTRCNDSPARGGLLAIRPEVFENIHGPMEGALAVFDVPSGVFLLQHLLLRNAEEKRDPAVTETALRIVDEMVQKGTESTRAAATETTVDVQALLAASLTERVSLREIARRVHRSPSYLCRTFHQETGLRMRLYLQRLRICASVADVLDRHTNLSALAQTLGYSSHSHFGAAFRRELRVAPAELRRIAALPSLAQMQKAIFR